LPFFIIVLFGGIRNSVVLNKINDLAQKNIDELIIN